MQQDAQTNNQLLSYYQQALDEIRNHLEQFYAAYASATGLTMADAQKQVNNFDLVQFKRAIDLVGTQLKDHGDSDDKEFAGSRIRLIKAMASTGIRQHVLLALIGTSILMATLKSKQASRERLIKDVSDEINRQDMPHKTVVKPQTVDQVVNSLKTSRTIKKHLIISMRQPVENLSTTVWNTNDVLNSQIVTAIQKKLMGQGLTKQDITDMMQHLNTDNIRANSPADFLKKAQYRVDRVVRTETARVAGQIEMADFWQRHVKYIGVANQPGACKYCQDIAGSGPYPIDEVPERPFHPNCRCEYYEESGDPFAR